MSSHGGSKDETLNGFVSVSVEFRTMMQKELLKIEENITTLISKDISLAYTFVSLHSFFSNKLYERNYIKVYFCWEII